jgi:NADH:ubiquinone oxidoreductase subunit 5 (subunit L)/multisubunit Na+/H+ antiporter MnhA subunit
MNSNAYIVSGIIAFVFLVAKFLEMRFFGANNANANANANEDEEAPQSQSKPLKFLLRDALLVYVSSLLGFYIIAQFEEHAAVTGSAVKEVAAFTGGPDF